MAKYNLEEYKESDGLGFPVNFRRGAPNPLDNSAVWKSLDEAKNYATTSPVAYVGQVLSILNETHDNATVYVIMNEAGDLKEVGTAPIGDNKTIKVDDNVLKLVGIDDLEFEREGVSVKYQPVLVDGTLTWVEPSATTVEGLDTRLQTVEGAIGKKAVDEEAATGLYKYIDDGDAASKAYADSINTSLLGKIAEEATAREGAISSLDESLKAYVGEQIGAQAHFSAKVVANTEEMTDATVLYLIKDESAVGNDLYKEYLIIEGAPTLIGDTSTNLSDYETTAKVDEKVKAVQDAIDAYKESAAAEHKTMLDKIGALEEVGAEKNVIATVDTEQFAIDEARNLTLLDVAMAKVTGLADALAKKVDVVEGSTLLSADDKKKLDALVLGDTGGVEISGKVNIANVQGIDDYVANNRFISQTLLDKINASQANVIENIKIEGAETALAIDETKTITIPKASAEAYGVVKIGVEATNNVVSVDEAGIAQVKKISVSSLEQGEGETLIFNCGSAV